MGAVWANGWGSMCLDNSSTVTLCLILDLVKRLRANNLSPYEYPFKGADAFGLKKADQMLQDASLQARGTTVNGTLQLIDRKLTPLP